MTGALRGRRCLLLCSILRDNIPVIIHKGARIRENHHLRRFLLCCFCYLCASTSRISFVDTGIKIPPIAQCVGGRKTIGHTFRQRVFRCQTSLLVCRRNFLVNPEIPRRSEVSDRETHTARRNTRVCDRAQRSAETVSSTPSP